MLKLLHVKVGSQNEVWRLPGQLELHSGSHQPQGEVLFIVSLNISVHTVFTKYVNVFCYRLGVTNKNVVALKKQW